MSYELITKKGSLGQLSTIRGWHNVAEYIERFGGPELKKFVANGATENVQLTKVEAKALAMQAKNKYVRSTLQNLVTLLEGATEFAAIE